MTGIAFITLFLIVTHDTVLGKTNGENCIVRKGNVCICCSSGYGGVNCTVQCSNCVTHIETAGECINKCSQGFYGGECNIQCPEHCAPGLRGVNICKKEDGICLNECRSGFHGIKCEKRCSSNCNNGICFQNDGTCNGCRDLLTYGEQCSKTCNNNCVNRTCEQDGRCVEGCKQGFYGNNCSFECGKHCHKHLCSIDDEFKFRCTLGCDRGYTQIDCEHECQDHCSICHQEGSCIVCDKGYVLTADEDSGSKGFTHCEVEKSAKIANDVNPSEAVFGILFCAVFIILIVSILKRNQRFKNWLMRNGKSLSGWIAVKENDDMPVQAIGGNERRIILLGKTGAGKSETGNTLFMEDCFQSRSKFARPDDPCKHETIWRDRFNKKLLIVDTAELFDTSMTPQVIKQVILEVVQRATPGPHAFILVKSQGVIFSEEEITVLETLRQSSENKLLRHMIVVLTGSDQRRETVEEWISRCPPDQQKFFQEAGGGYMAISNGGTREQRQQEARNLFRRIEKVVQQNNGGFFSPDMFSEAINLA